MMSRVLPSLAVIVLVFSGCASRMAARTQGWQLPLGNGTVSSYAEFDDQGNPAAIGVHWSAAALEGLPSGSDNHRCFNRDKEGKLSAETKCQHTYEHVIPLPDTVVRRADFPFKWVLLNWNPAGHIPPGIYDVPHFDVHFQMAHIAKIFSIEPGPCGPEFVRCDQFQMGKKAVPANYIHPDFKDVDAVVPAMGNHLIDLTGPEFRKQPFTRSFIYGVFDGHVIFWEEMVTRTHLLSKPNTCMPIKAPRAVAQRGFYPTISCVRHDAATGGYTVSMEKFVLREASPPEPQASK